MNRLLLGYKTAHKSEVPTVLYIGNDGDAEEAAFKKSKLYRHEFVQVDRIRKRKLKEDYTPAEVADNAKKEADNAKKVATKKVATKKGIDPEDAAALL